MTVYDFSDFRDYLRAALNIREQKNPGYSLRAFARSCGLGNSTLWGAISGRSRLSMSAALKIATALKLRSRERSYFCDLVLLDSRPDDLALQSEIRSRLERQRPRSRPIEDLSMDEFRQIADWFHSAILELPFVSNFLLTPETASQALRIPLSAAKGAIDRLEKLGLLENTANGFRRVQNEVRIRSDLKNSALRSLYRQMLKKISISLEEQSPRERLSGYLTIPVAPEALPEVDQAITRFFEDVRSITERHKNHSNVYHLALHFFNLTPKVSTSAKGKSHDTDQVQI